MSFSAKPPKMSPAFAVPRTESVQRPFSAYDETKRVSPIEQDNLTEHDNSTGHDNSTKCDNLTDRDKQTGEIKETENLPERANIPKSSLLETNIQVDDPVEKKPAN